MANALMAEGLRTGLFVSPHIHSFRERVRIDDELISRNDVVKYMRHILSTAESKQIPATFFELVTALSFLYFAENGVDYAVIEAGLGGRLDATNILRRPQLCVMTSVGLDHTRILGNSMESIAREKAGIAKSGVPMLVGPNVPKQVVALECAKVSAPMFEVQPGSFELAERVLQSEKSGSIPNHFDFARYDLENIALAAESLRMIGREYPPNISALRARPSCRLEVVGRTILDTAHNPPAIRHFMETTFVLREKRRSAIVLALSRDKDAEAIGKVVSGLRRGSKLFIACAPTRRALPLDDLREHLKSAGIPDQEIRDVHEGVASAVERALDEVGDEGVVLVCGSVFMMSDAMRALGKDVELDPIIHER